MEDDWKSDELIIDQNIFLHFVQFWIQYDNHTGIKTNHVFTQCVLNITSWEMGSINLPYQ